LLIKDGMMVSEDKCMLELVGLYKPSRGQNMVIFSDVGFATLQKI
jgi:hypothetical protein